MATGSIRVRISGHFLCALTVFPVFLAAIFPCSGQSLPTVKLGAETVQAFQGYIGIQEDLYQQGMNGRRPFLWNDDPPRNRSMVETGEIVIEQDAGGGGGRAGRYHPELDRGRIHPRRVAAQDSETASGL